MAEPLELVPGVHLLDHTADVGIEVRAATLPELFQRAAAGMTALLWEGIEPRVAAAPPGAVVAPPEPLARELVLEAGEVAGLLAAWLRELLYLFEVQGLAFRAAEFEALDELRLRALVRGVRETEPPVRELKGVTYHALEVACWHGEWHARVIFDV